MKREDRSEFGSGKSMNIMQQAFQRGGFKMRMPAPKKWPRVRGVKATRIDCATGFATGFLR
jgi:hypothetical protein